MMQMSRSLDWPLSREEKKGRLLQLFQHEVDASDEILRSREAELEALKVRFRRSCPGLGLRDIVESKEIELELPSDEVPVPGEDISAQEYHRDALLAHPRSIIAPEAVTKIQTIDQEAPAGEIQQDAPSALSVPTDSTPVDRQSQHGDPEATEDAEPKTCSDLEAKTPVRETYRNVLVGIKTLVNHKVSPSAALSVPSREERPWWRDKQRAHQKCSESSPIPVSKRAASARPFVESHRAAWKHRDSCEQLLLSCFAGAPRQQVGARCTSSSSSSHYSCPADGGSNRSSAFSTPTAVGSPPINEQAKRAQRPSYSSNMTPRRSVGGGSRTSITPGRKALDMNPVVEQLPTFAWKPTLGPRSGPSLPDLNSLPEGEEAPSAV